MQKELIKLKEYFDNIFTGIDDNVSLDEQQRLTIINDSKYTMIVAGAGSGKTTTMAAKVKYLVEIKKINPKDIVMISFTNKAVDELKQRIQKDFKINCLICTFHKFGLILLNDKKLKIISDAYDIVLEFFEKELCFNNKILKKYINYFTNFFKIPKMVFLFHNLNDYYNIKNKLYKLINIKIEKKDIYYKQFILFCLQFIQKIKIKNYIINDVVTSNKKEKFFIDFINRLFNYYQNKLKENNMVDFDDIILKATKEINNKQLSYKYIIVDEYQDISKQRFEFIKKISDISNSKIIVVGDDWQTIYSFSGSEISLFLDFKKLVGQASLLKITNTYRNSQELINIAGNFVMKNKEQITKQLISSKSLNQPITISLYKNDKINKLYLCLKDIINKYGCNQSILLLGRYAFDINTYLGTIFYKKDNYVYCKKISNLKMVFLTVHSAKGLGFDQVIILNVNNEVYGFPSKVINDKLINLIDNNTNYILEERRLFYVALTRTKNKVYILSNKQKISPFVLELIKNNNVEVKK